MVHILFNKDFVSRKKFALHLHTEERSQRNIITLKGL